MSHYTFDLERSISKVKYSKIAKMQKSFFCHDSAVNNPIYFKKRPKYSSTVPILPRYILVKVEVKDQGQDVKMPKLFFGCPSHMVRFTSGTDYNVPIPGRVCLLCLALHICLLIYQVSSPFFKKTPIVRSG